MTDELNNPTDPNQLPAGDVSPVIDEPVKEVVADPGAAAPQGPPESVPYERFKEKNEEAKGLKDENAVLRNLLINRGQQPSAPQAQEVRLDLQAPAFVPPPPPPASEYTDEDGYEDQVQKAMAMATWATQKTLAEADHKRTVEKSKAAEQTNIDRARNFVAKVSAKFPDFQEGIRVSGNPNDHVAASIIAMDEQDTEAAEKVAYHLAKNPGEMQRINMLSPLQASIEVGRLAFKLSLPKVEPKTVSGAPPPNEPVKNTQTTAPFDPLKADMKTYARQHPARAPWIE